MNKNGSSPELLLLPTEPFSALFKRRGGRKKRVRRASDVKIERGSFTGRRRFLDRRNILTANDLVATILPDNVATYALRVAVAVAADDLVLKQI